MDGSYSEKNNVGGVGYYVPQRNIRFGTKLDGTLSPLACEIHAIYQAIKYVTQCQEEKVVILTDSLRVMNKIINRMENREREN